MHPRLVAVISLPLLVVGCIDVFLPTFGSAQTPDPVATRQAALQALSDSQWIRLTSASFGRREGQLLAHSATELVLALEPEPLRIPATRIDTLWAKGTASKSGAIVGGLLGAGVGVLVATQAVEKGETPGADWVLAIGGGGAVSGGLLGALIGSAFPRWQRRYPR
jgi:hypothetical protein